MEANIFKILEKITMWRITQRFLQGRMCDTKVSQSFKVKVVLDGGCRSTKENGEHTPKKTSHSVDFFIVVFRVITPVEPGKVSVLFVDVNLQECFLDVSRYRHQVTPKSKQETKEIRN
ncbi:hypothetical protein AVEN_89285-1 [Araneus ventricosus]|uniref:Uncharacterized protein n=1 Tax=Araneus ventricosus TaxID=182803 RepID=A0A4Y2SJ68_ARAVE|nr:hypothetical protein AVEN_89285-1 [Araneus ventricosus]